MAKAITQIRKESVDIKYEQSQAVGEIIQELSSNKEAVIEAIHIIKGLHEMKVLEAMKSLLEQGEQVGAIAIQQFNQPTMHNVIKNGMNTFSFLGSLKPGQLLTILEGLSIGLKRLSETGEEAKKQSIWKLRKRLWSPEIRMMMTSMVDFMDGMGSAFLRKGRENP